MPKKAKARPRSERDVVRDIMALAQSRIVGLTALQKKKHEARAQRVREAFARGMRP